MRVLFDPDPLASDQRFAEKRNLDQHRKSDSVPCPKWSVSLIQFTPVNLTVASSDKTIEHKRNLKGHMDNCG